MTNHYLLAYRFLAKTVVFTGYMVNPKPKKHKKSKSLAVSHTNYALSNMVDPIPTTISYSIRHVARMVALSKKGCRAICCAQPSSSWRAVSRLHHRTGERFER